MKKYIILFISILGITWLSYGQVSITVSTPDNTSKEYIARDYVRFTKGYSFKAEAGKTLRAAIDPNIMAPASYLRASEVPALNRELNTSSCSVGSMPGILDISPTGAATYSIPIEVAQGVMGVQPNLALVYNSQAGNGIAGWGFNISGLSAITRVPKNIYLDEMAAGVRGERNDGYALDGNRLLVVGQSVYGANGTEYRTEMETFAKITSKGNYAGLSGPDWFEVIAKDGTIYKYGSASGKLEYSKSFSSYPEPPITHACVQAWQLDYAQSPNGQTVTYQYENTDLCSYIKKITYGNNSVEFFYETREDVIPVHFISKKGTVDRILHKIVCRQAGTVFREYKLEYTKDHYSRLVSITESNGSGETYNPTVFEWGVSAGNAIKTEDINIQPLGHSPFIDYQMYLSADINGDGLTDLFAVYGDVVNNLITNCYMDYYMAYKDNSGNTKFSYQGNYYIGSNVHIFSAIKSYAAGTSAADLNGDGKQELLFAGYVKILDKEGVRFIIVKNSFQEESFTMELIASSQAPAYTVGDLNNDGKSEIIYLEKPDYFLSPYILSDIYPGKIISPGNGTFDILIKTAGGIPQELIVADFDGDGLNDLCVLSEKGYAIYYNNGGNFSNMFSVNNATVSTAFNSEYSCVRTGDFNGDGLPDFLLNKPNSANWYIALNNGDRTFSITPSALTSYNFIKEDFIQNNTTDECFVMDFNGDGKSDIIISDATFQKTSWLITFNSHRIGFFRSIETDFQLVTGSTYTGPVPKKYFVSGDFNGDGMQEMMIYTNNDPTKWRLYSNQEYTTQSGKITGIADGLNNKIKLEYAPLTDKSIYQKQESVSYPVAEIQVPLSVVKKVTFDLGINTENSVSYTYKGAKVHQQGKGFLGFGEITARNTTLDRKITTSYKCDNDYFYPCMEKQEITTAGGQPISTTSYTYDYGKPEGSSFSDKRFFPYIKKQTLTDELTTLSATTEIISIDGYGNPKTIKTTKGGLTETQTINYVQKGSWCPNKVENMQVVSSYSGNTHTRKTAYEYDNNGNLTQETIDPDDDNRVVTQYQNFNAAGQPQSITVTANGTSRTTSQTYTPSNRFAGTKTNVLGETTSYSWDETKGVLKSITDHRNRTIHYGYNNWGTLTSTSYPDGIKTTGTLQWENNAPGKPDNALYYSCTETSGQSPVWTWYDAKGREIRKDYFGLNREKIYVDMEYNTKGQLYRTSKPYFAGTEKTQEATYAYDTYGRVSTVTTPMGTTAYEYSGTETTVTSPAGEKITTLNNSGFVESEEVNDKKVEFTYYASGLMKSAAPQDGQAISMKYDLQGNRTELNDPDAGVITSKYNGWGELKWTKQKIHIDQGLITTEYDYHPNSGLLNFVKNGNDTTNYSYDNLNRLQEISIAGQHKQAFTYDTYDRITNVREELDGKIFDAKTEYDSYGRILKETYPSGYYTVNQYDDYGYLAKITDRSDRPVWEAVEANEYGQLTRIKNGQKETTFNFDDKGFLTSISTPGIMNWSYGYDEKGNMVSRKDAIANHTESMSYDEMNRLTAWDIYQGTAKVKEHSMSYDPVTGNIEKKSSLDNLTLNYGENGKPHTLTSILGTPTNFPANDLEITYTDFKKIKTLLERDENGDVVKSYGLTYGVDQQRRKSVYTDDNTTLTRYYLGNYEVEENSNGNIRKIHYLRGGGIFIDDNGQESLLYAYTDHLGSLTVLTDETGDPIEHYAYDPWGNRRIWNDWAQPDNGPWMLNRGFTGHEHIDQFGIINMNGRVYDPITSQFFSPDPYVQALANWVNYNRYAYCLNNPLRFTDPSGEWIEWVIAGIILYAANAKANTPDGKDNGKLSNWEWNPIKWFKKDGTFTVSVNANTDGNVTVSGGIGSPQYPIPVAGYNTQNGFGIGVSNNGSSNIYYPGYNYNAPEQKVNKAINDVRESQKLDWRGASHGQKIQAFLDSYKKAFMDSDALYFDIREDVKNFPIGGEGNTYMDYLNINGERMLVSLTLAVYDNMKISVDYTQLSDKTIIPDKLINGIIKKGDWSDYAFYRYTNLRVKDPIPMARLQVPIRHRDAFSNYLRNR